MLLADTSAWIWSRRKAYPELRAWFDAELTAGRIATCGLVTLELLYGVRSGSAHDQRSEELGALATYAIDGPQWGRAIEVQNALAHLGPDRHKAVRIQDLLVAAAAEAAGVGLLHYDGDFELVQEITGQPMRWLARKGSLR